jgi:hypothetical protein
MKKALFALAPLFLFSSLSFATPLRKQIATDIRFLPRAKGLKFATKYIKTVLFNGPRGRFSFTASKAGQRYSVSGGFLKTGEGVAISTLKIVRAK